MKRTVVTMIVGMLAVFTWSTLWQPAEANELIKLDAGGKGLTIASKATGVSAELLVSGGALDTSKVKESSNFPLIEVAPAGEALELRCKARFVTVPGFHNDDALFDPTVCKFKTNYVPSDNWLLIVPEGGKSAFVLAWPIEESQAPSKQVPVAVVEGSGQDARFGTVRVNFAGRPIFVGVLDNVAYVDGLDTKNIAYTKKVDDQDRSLGFKYAEVDTGEKLPVGAHYWTTITRPVGKPDPEYKGWLRSAETAIAGLPSWTWIVVEPPHSTWDDVLSWYQRGLSACPSPEGSHRDTQRYPPRGTGQRGIAEGR
jgi:hypothetical protein